MNDISVIIPIHEINDELIIQFDKCIQSIKNQVVRPKKVYVIRANTKELKEFFNSWEKPEELDITILNNENKTDFCSQINHGVENIDTEWFSILEIDDEYSKNWFKNVVSYMEYHEVI